MAPTLRVNSVVTLFTRVRSSLVTVQENLHMNRPLEKRDHVNFDKALYHFAMIPDRMENLRIFSGTKNRLNFYKRFHNCMVWFILFAYFVRSMACFFISNRRWLMYLGDISPYMGGARIMYLIPVAGWSFYALALNTLFTMDPRATEWLYPFGVLKGLIVPSEAGFHEPRQLKKLIFRIKLTAAAIEGMILSAAILAGLLFMTIPFYKYESRQDAYLYGLPWGLLQSLWTYYCAGNICGNFGYFHDLCYYLALRFKYVNQQMKYLVENKKEITDIKMNKTLIALVNEHEQITKEVVRYNIFWSRYAAINYFTFIPLECFVLFITFFAKIELMIWMTFSVLAMNCGAILGIVVLSGAMVSQEAHRLYNDTCSLAVLKMPTAVKFKLLSMVQKLGGPKIGFGCLNLFIMTHETFYNMIVAVGSFFLLIVDFLQSKLTS